MGIFDFIKNKSNIVPKYAVNRNAGFEKTCSAADLPVRYTGYCFSTTGAFGHIFRWEGHDVLRAMSMVLPEPEIAISGFGQNIVYESKQKYNTLIPGVRRRFKTEDGEELAYYRFEDYDEFSLVCPGAKARVIRDGDQWRVYQEDTLVAHISIIPEEVRERRRERGGEMESRFAVAVASGLEPELYPYILMIPVVGF